MLAPVHLSEGFRFFRRRLGFRGFHRFGGDAWSICTQVLDSCWNGRFLQTSSGHFRQVYARDLGWCAPALVALGWRDRVVATLDYALERWSRFGRITVAFTPSGRPFDFPDFPSLDSVAYVFSALKVARARALVEKHRSFLQGQLSHVASFVQDDGLPKRGNFSGMRDHALRSQSCYDTAALAFLSDSASDLGLDSQLPRVSEYSRLLRSRFWTGSHFLDDLSGKKIVTADANLFPFWWGVVRDRKLMKSAFRVMQAEGLDSPFPLRYVSRSEKSDHMIWLERFVPSWERTAFWPQLGLPYIELLSSFDRGRALGHLGAYSRLIERHGTYVEVLTSDGEPFKTPFYVADEGLLWASQYLYVARKLRRGG